MDYLFLICIVAFGVCQNILCAAYNRKTAGNADATLLYTFLLIGSAFLCWVAAFIIDVQVSADVIIYSLLYALGFTVAHWALANALRVGPIAITSLIVQLSLIGATVWGFVFWDAAFRTYTLIGLCLVAVALWLCLKGKSNGKEKNVSFVWLVYALLAFAANAVCTIVQKTQQISSEGKYGTFCMLLAVGFSLLANGAGLLRKRSAVNWKCLKGNWIFPALAGVCNGLINLFVIRLAVGTLSPGLIYPVIAVGTLAMTTVCSSLVFREKMSIRQWIGIVIGAAGVIFLSI